MTPRFTMMTAEYPSIAAERPNGLKFCFVPSLLFRLEAAITCKFQCSAVLRDCLHDFIGSAFGNVRFDFQSHAYR